MNCFSAPGHRIAVCRTGASRMSQKRAMRGKIFASLLAALFVAAAFVPIAPTPAAASTADLTISGQIVSDPSANHILEYYDFSIGLSRPGDTWPVVYQNFRGPDFVISAPEPGAYTLHIGPLPSDPPSPWAGTWFGDTPFPWHAAEIIVDGTTPITDLVITIPQSGTVSGQITAPGIGLNYGLTADAFLLDPETGRYQHISRASRDFDGPYTISNLPQGRYVVRFGHFGGNRYEEKRDYPSTYYGGSRYPDEAQSVEVVTEGAVQGIDGALDLWSFDVTRTAGVDRYDTAVRLSQGAFEAGVPSVYLASGAAWADALSAAPAAAHFGGPLLLTAPDHVPTVVLSELARLQPREIVIAGGPAAVSNSVMDTLRAEGYAVRRVAGADRYDTSRRLAVDAFSGFPDEVSAWIATGRGFADALSAASDASRVDVPLILVDGEALAVDGPTVSAFTELGITQFKVAGGQVAIGQRYVSSVEAAFGGGSTYRVAGADRYETSRLISTHFSRDFEMSTGRAFLAVGTGYADALAAAPIAGLTSSPLILTPGNCVPSASLSALVELDAFHVELVGGPAALGAGVENLTSC